MPKKKAAKKKAAKKKNVKTLSQTDGMIKDDGQEFVPSTLDQVFGDDGVSKYSTLDSDVYSQVLANMSKSDLKAEAVRCGLLPIDNVEQLVSRLKREFTAHVSSYKRPSVEIRHIDDISPEARSILEEGK
tara:strand:- start:763 stop:1152 length:390 start_codon:yes stop_codon:yes gene_type:complete